MTSHNSSSAQAPRRTMPGRRMAIPGMVTLLLVFILLVATISFLWYEGQKLYVEPYYEIREKQVSLHPLVQDVQVHVEYPRRISRNDRGAQHHKRIVIGTTKTKAGPSEVIRLAIQPVSGSIRFLAEDGNDVSGQLTITATHGIEEVRTLYIEHPNMRLTGSISLSLQVLPPTRDITEPVIVCNFDIEEESFVAATIRGVVSLWPWETFLLAFLALPGAFLKTLWDRRGSMAGLYERMKQAWTGRDIADIRRIYSDYRGLVLFRVPLLQGAALDIPGHRSLELLRRRVEASFHFDRADALKRIAIAEARDHLATALAWDADYAKMRSDYELVRGLEKAQGAWWIKPVPGIRYLRWLSRTVEDRGQTPAEIRRRIVNILGHVETFEARRAVERTLREDVSLSVRAQAAWMLARKSQPEMEGDRILRFGRREVVEEWLGRFPSPLDYNPFEAATAKDDVLLNRHFFQHPGYVRLRSYNSQSVALFAGPGGGKTTCRRILKLLLEQQNPANLVVEYTDFSTLVRDVCGISVESHIQGILHQASASLGTRPWFLPRYARGWQEKVDWLLQYSSKRGYSEMCVLVDNVDGYETQSDPTVMEALVRHLVANLDLLDIDHLSFKFFLPLSLRERLLGLGGFSTGRVKIVDVEWTNDLLKGVLETRLTAASSQRRQVDSLAAFANEQTDLDKLVLDQAKGSPRQLVFLVGLLFSHRAQIWHESGRGSEELYITMADWAILLEYLLKHGTVV